MNDLKKKIEEGETDMTQTEYQELIEKCPGLTSEGFGISKNARQELQESFMAFTECVNWIEAHPLFERGWSSYTLKHEVENWLKEEGRYRYIPQGAMILASLSKGVQVKRIPDDRGVYVG